MPAFAFNAPGSFTDLSFDQANGDAINTDEYRAAAKHLVELFSQCIIPLLPQSCDVVRREYQRRTPDVPEVAAEIPPNDLYR